MTINNYQGSSIASIDRVSVAKSSVRQDDTLPVRLVAAKGNVKYGVEFDSKSETSFRPWKFLPALMTASNDVLCKLLVLWLAVERKLVRWLSVRHFVDLEPFHCGLAGLESIQGLFKHNILLTLRKPGMILSTSWMSFRFSARGSLTSIAITLMVFVLRLIKRCTFEASPSSRSHPHRSSQTLQGPWPWGRCLWEKDQMMIDSWK